MENKKPKVFVGVSGGVDSSVSLALLKERGFDVTGVFLKVWHPDFLPCNWKEERRSAMRVCATLGVPFMTIDCEKEYKKEVVDYMISEYKIGRTPNPDIFCNKYVKFGIFLKKALEMGADFVATGHYAQNFIFDKSLPRKDVSENGSEEKEIYKLHESVDKNKDQSYFLYTLNQEQLSKTLFPVGHLTKPEVRKLAEKSGLPTATKKDSQGLCFIGKIDMKDFLSHYTESKKGDVLNSKGEAIGVHDGALFYTIGQRHGFTITKKTPNDPSFFVVAKDIEKNTITIADKETQKDLVFNTKEVLLNSIHFVSGIEPKFPFSCQVRIRYRQEKQNCKIEKRNKGFHIYFEKPQNGVAIGQSAVLYLGEECFGGGIIEETI
ncbi:MAG: tRNA 2-thiouridine(34) synthase MnmA [Candidatus Paceibacterota bacterium]